MKSNEFEKLIDKNKYQVFLFSSPVPIPLNFAIHTWFVINLKGKIHRWEFGSFRGSPHPNGIGVLKDFLEPTKGMNFYWWKANPRFDSKLISFIEGNDKSIAKDLALFIEKNSNKYPLKNTYKLLGPNSNSFMSWILEKFPNSKLKLPFNAFGKNYKVSE